MEQGRLNDAARFGQSTDLVMAPLFLLCFCLSQLLLSVVFLVYVLDFHRDFPVCFANSLWVPFLSKHIASAYFSENLFIYVMSSNNSSSLPPQCVLWQ